MPTEDDKKTMPPVPSPATDDPMLTGIIESAHRSFLTDGNARDAILNAVVKAWQSGYMAGQTELAVSQALAGVDAAVASSGRLKEIFSQFNADMKANKDAEDERDRLATVNDLDRN